MVSLAEMSGEKKRAPQLKLNEININGQKGSFVYRDVLGGLKSDGVREKYEKRDIGEEIEVVFLKVRRKMVKTVRDARPIATNEHNTKSDLLTVFGADGGIVKGYSDDLREKFPGLKTVQVIYALYNGELVRLFVKGSALGSAAKDKSGEMSFYDYISSFKKDNRDDHFFEFKTKLKVVEEKGDLGSYYCMGFERGDKLTSEEMKLVEEKMTIAYDHAVAVDNHYQTADTTSSPDTYASDEVHVNNDGYPTDDISPEDIPF